MKKFWEFYEKYLGEKCSRMTFYNRVKKGMDLLEALKPVQREKRHPSGGVRSKRFADEMRWYQSQDNPKISRQIFYQRLHRGYTKEEAIKIEDFVPKKKSPATVRPGYVRTVIPKKKPIIDTPVKYQKEEADIIKKEYEKMIDELDYQWRVSDDPTEAKEITDRLEELRNEYNRFCLTNY